MVGEINYGLVDTSLPERYANPFARGAANRLAMQQAEQTTASNALSLKSKQQTMEDEQAVRQAYAQSGGDIGKVVSGLKQAGQYKPAMEIEGKMGEQRNAQIDQAIKGISLIKALAPRVMANPTQESAVAVANEYAQATGQDPAPLLQEIQALGGNPEAIKQWAAGHAFEADKLLPKLQTLNLGGTERLASIDPLTGKVIGQQDFAKTMSPGERAADARARQANVLKAEENKITREGTVGKQVREVEMKLADDYRTESKGFAETSTAMKKIMGSIEQADTNPGAALSAGTAFMKLLDPNSVVRETELGMALNASGWFDRATNIAQTLQSGKVMTATQQKNLKAAAETLFEEAKSAQREIDASYKTRATQYGADPNRVIVERGQSTFKGAPKLGTVQDGYRYKGGDPADPSSWEKQ